MVTAFDPSQNSQVTISAELYNYTILLIIMVSNLYYFLFKAIVQSFFSVPLGNINLRPDILYENSIRYISEYFIIAFRIAMPMFIGIMLVNVILGVLAKSSPQMNMFAVGMQIKTLAGLFILSVTIVFIPNITIFLIEKMQNMLYETMKGL